jgi:hypothetical protein
MTDEPLQSATGTGIAQAFGEGARTSFRSEEIAALLQALSAMQAKIDELARQPRQDARGSHIAQADRGGTSMTLADYLQLNLPTARPKSSLTCQRGQVCLQLGGIRKTICHVAERDNQVTVVQ